MTRNSPYQTKQRVRILSYLKEHPFCMTAEQIINGLSEQGARVSRTTVYRTLDFYCLDGSVMRFSGDTGEGAVYRYSGGHGSHFHIKCTECGSTVCIDCKFADSMEQHLLSHHGFVVNQGMSIFYGVCSPCRSKKQPLHAENKT